MVSLMGFDSIRPIGPYDDRLKEQTMETSFNLDHKGTTPSGLVATVNAKLVKVEERKLAFFFAANGGIGRFSEYTQARIIVNFERFNAAVAQKQAIGPS